MGSRRKSSPENSGSGRVVMIAIFAIVFIGWAGMKLTGGPRVEEIAPNAIYNNIRSGRTVVMFGADWCGWCKKLEPGLGRMAKAREDVRFLKVEANTPRSSDRFWNDFAVNAYPTIVVYRDGIETGRQVGYLPDAPLDAFLQQSLAR